MSFKDMFDEHLQVGASRAAFLLAASPLKVAAYSDEFDCSVILTYDKMASERIATSRGDLHAGMRLLTVSTYSRWLKLESDLWNGPASRPRYTNFYPDDR
jgi:hypothetical protein